jgi:hypothetical protein
VRVVLEDQLLEVEEGTLVRDLLADLNTRSPGVGGVGFGTVGALGIDDDEFDFEGLDEEGRLESLSPGISFFLQDRSTPNIKAQHTS